MLGTLVLIAAYGTWKTRRDGTREDYLRGGHADRWWVVGFGVVATQLSAVTFISTPGQGFLDGMRFVQFYFGLPLAMIVVAAVFIPLYYKWNVYTAYEFIGRRFDRRARLLTALLFLCLRGLSAGITIYAPMLVLDRVLGVGYGWSFALTGLVIVYTTVGGARAVSATQTQQMAVIFLGLIVTLLLVIHQLSDRMTFSESLHLAGAAGRMNIITTNFDADDKFTLWSGLIGGFFLQLSYFGTDQSQVGRYLNGRTVREAKLGMMFNGLVKIPMQFIVLLTGVLVFVYFLFHPSPVHWNAQNAAALKGLPAFDSLNAGHDRHEADVREHAVAWLDALRADDADRKTSSREALNNALVADAAVRDSVRALVEERLPGSDPRDDDHIFLSFVMSHFPTGILGLFVAVMFCASMSTSAAELSALASTTTVDVIRRDWSEQGQIRATRWATIAFGLLAMAFAGVASQLGNLIQAVNTIGSLFYGTILGIFLVAFLLKRVQGLALFVAALVAEAVILVLFALQSYEVIRPIGFLWFNLIAPAIVLLGASGLQALLPGAGIERTIDRSE